MERGRKDRSFITLPITTGANDSHSGSGIWWPNTNWEAPALKNGSKAVDKQQHKISEMIKLRNNSRLLSRLLLPLMVCVKDTATAANDTFDITWPRAWQIATGVRTPRSSLFIGCWLKQQTINLNQTKKSDSINAYGRKSQEKLEIYGAFW